MIAACLLVLAGCGGDSSNSSDAQALIDDNTPTVSGPTPTGGTVSVLTGLTDLGDLFEPDGDHWYFTRPATIHDNDLVVGTSNNGWLNRAAFIWDPATDLMDDFLTIPRFPPENPPLGPFNPPGPFNDYYFRKIVDPVDPLIGFHKSVAVDLNANGDIIGNSFASTEGKRAFIIQGGEFIDLPPILDTSVDFEIRTYSEAVDINEKREVVLTLDNKFGRHAYYWDGQSFHTVFLPTDEDDGDDTTPPVTIPVTVPSYIPLARIVGEDSEAVAINESGHVAINSGCTPIYYDLNWGTYNGLNWDIFEVLNHLPGYDDPCTSAVDINDSKYTNHDGIPDAHIIGHTFDGAVPEEAFSESGNLFEREKLNISLALIKTSESVQGFFWDGGAMYPVDHLGGGTSVTTDINDNDQVVGAATTDSGAYHAILWTLDPVTEKGVIRDLGTLGGTNSFATAINEAGQITGFSETGELYNEQGVVVPVFHAFLWNDGTMYDLGTHDDFYDYPFTPPYPFSVGVDINASGKVTGSSITINNHHRGFYLAPALP
jgi:probable HAF family extracellular repeat protein